MEVKLGKTLYMELGFFCFDSWLFSLYADMFVCVCMYLCLSSS